MTKGRKCLKSTCLIVKDAEVDRISCLPENLIYNIFQFLKIKEIVQTSVLSRKWRTKWYTTPNLMFGRQCLPASDSQDPSVIENKFLRIIDHVLLLHSGPIDKFMFTDNEIDLVHVNPATDIDRWILHISRRSIKEIYLEVEIKGRYKIPWCLFSCQSLHHLSLYCCQLKPPTTFEGFKNLKILTLHVVTVAQDAFENMIYGCPLLEELTLHKVDGFIQINIHAPNLKLFQIDGIFEDISFENSFQLTKVFVDLNIYMNSEINQRRILDGCSSNLLKFFVHRPHIQSIEIGNYFLKYLAAGDVPVKLPTPCVDLSYLSLCINFNDLKEILTAFSLLRSSPNLKKFEISARFKKQIVLFTPTSYCWEDTFSGPVMPIRVRHVTIEGISGITSELDFIRFLLLYSPMLEKMTVKPVVNVKPALMTELIRFKRASREAEIIYHGKDNS